MPTNAKKGHKKAKNAEKCRKMPQKATKRPKKAKNALNAKKYRGQGVPIGLLDV
jgi:hypothetical protein